MSSTTSKPVIVFVPGYGATGETYAPLLRWLDKYYDVRTADLPLIFPRRLSWRFFFAAIEAVAPNEPFILVGHSMGGATALAYAAEHPDRIKATVAVAPLAFPLLRPPRPGRRIRSVRLASEAGMLEHLQDVRRIRRTVLAGGRRQMLMRWIARLDLSDHLHRIEHAHVLWPVKEEIIPPLQFIQLLYESPNIDARVVPGSHNSLALAPQPLLPIFQEILDTER